tara:strand:- start:344 stop:1129 length:786 start_codon:yes stop_codon:yes gene_type:complete
MHLTKLKQIIREELKQVLLETNNLDDPLELTSEFKKKLQRSKPTTRDAKQMKNTTLQHLRKIENALVSANKMYGNKVCSKFKQGAYRNSKKFSEFVKKVHWAVGGGEHTEDERADLWATPVTPDYVDSMAERIIQATERGKDSSCDVSFGGSRSRIYNNGHKLRTAPRGTFIIDYYTPTCGPCMELEPILIGVASELGIPIVKVNIDNDESPRWHEGELPETTPTIALVKNGRRIVWADSNRPLMISSKIQRLRDFLKQNN